MSSILFEKNYGNVISALSRLDGDIPAATTTLAVLTAASKRSMDESSMLQILHVVDGPMTAIISTAQEDISVGAIKPTTFKVDETQCNALTGKKILNKRAATVSLEDDNYRFEYEDGLLGKEIRCSVGTVDIHKMRNSQKSFGSEKEKSHKKVQTKPTDDKQYGQFVVGEMALDSCISGDGVKNCISKLQPAVVTVNTISHEDHYFKSSLHKSAHDNNSNLSAVLQGWLQGMRETSPPRTTSPTNTVPCSPIQMREQIEAAITREDFELIHRAWMVKHPSALDDWEKIIEATRGKRVAVFLDYDGTLSPIVEDPDRAFLSHHMRVIVKDVAKVFPTAIISGRCKEKLHEFVQLPELYYAGSHGMEIVGPATPLRESNETRLSHAKGSNRVLFQPAKEFTLTMDKVFKVLVEKTKAVPGVRIESNTFCVSVHFRCVKERHWMTLAEHVQQVLQGFPNLRLTQGRKVLEIRPTIAWNKGKALDFLLKALGLNDQNTVFPIYVGDDRSDEDAFKVLTRRKHGLGILVTTAAKETNAMCSLRDPSEVGEFLRRLAKFKRRRIISNYI